MKDIAPISIRILIVLMLCSFLGRSQVNKVPNLQKFDYAPYHFGFTLAMNQMFFSLKTVENMEDIWFKKQSIPDIFVADSARVLSLNSEESFGFTIGIVSNLRLGEYFDLRFVPDLAFGERDLIYEIEYDDQNLPGFSPDTLISDKKIYSTLVEFPVHIKYKAMRLQNSRVYVLAGMKYTLDLAKESKKMADESDNKHVKINMNDFLAEAGVGFDFYTTYFKFGVELKMGYGFKDILEREDNIYTDSIEELRSKIFQLTFTFE
ncbi:MAG TPA: outer membrane beta-barrel protein [Bacteroidales bacterium]|nr:outer membrane beta-barrel protein [Bacteroidales bacterium]HRZ21876.1 outer membrane beta-barrel protein [Bacteroidales bacterium]